MTELLYMQGFDMEDCEAEIISASPVKDGRVDLVLDKTCFYARGGGQDWDTGIISSGDTTFEVEEVRLDEHGDVHHIGKYTSGSFAADDSVTCKVDHERRAMNTRLHSAGHVIDIAIDKLDLDWVAEKGQHYPHLSAVEYSGTWQPEQAEDIRIAIEKQVNEFVAQALENSITFMPVEEMHKVVKHVPDNIPTNKPGRVVMYGDNFGIPCGGTHVKNLREVGVIKIPKLKEKKGVTRVSYAVEGIN